MLRDDILLSEPAPADSSWPVFGLADDVRPFLSEMIAAKEPGALATLVKMDGPSPRPLGSQLAIAADGRVQGFVSGGCVESNVALMGLEVAQAGRPRRVTFGAGSPYIDVKLTCGGTIELFIERIAPGDQTIRAVIDARAARAPVTREVDANGNAAIRAPRPSEPASGVTEAGAMWRRYEPQLRIVVLGGDPVALATASLARQMGFESVLARHLGPESAPEGAATQYLAAAHVDALTKLALDRWTAVITTTHDLDDDHEALAYALPSHAFYVGALGSRRRLAERIARLEADQVSWEAIKRLHAPVGLDIGAATPYEIALSILAGIVRAYRVGESAG